MSPALGPRGRQPGGSCLRAVVLRPPRTTPSRRKAGARRPSPCKRAMYGHRRRGRPCGSDEHKHRTTALVQERRAHAGAQRRGNCSACARTTRSPTECAVGVLATATCFVALRPKTAPERLERARRQPRSVVTRALRAPWTRRRLTRGRATIVEGLGVDKNLRSETPALAINPKAVVTPSSAELRQPT